MIYKHKNKIKFLAGIILTNCLVYGQASDPKNDSVAKKSAYNLEDDIQYLQGRIPDLIKGLNLQDEDQIIIKMGAKHRPGNKERFIVVEKVVVKLSDGGISEITFVYDQSNENSLLREVRELVNKKPSDRDLSGLSILYSTSKGDKDEFAYNSISEHEQKVKVLRAYLDSLNEFVRWLDYFGERGGNKQKKTINKALSIGSV